MAPTPAPFVVLKFGGTSVSSAANWHRIRDVLKARLAAGVQPVVVHSALSGITDRLEHLLDLPAGRGSEAVLADIEAVHANLAKDLGIPLPRGVRRELIELRHIATGIALLHEVSDQIRARAMATGELMATELGAAWLATQGLDVEWVDARTVLLAEARPGASTKANILSATCNYAPDAALQQRLANPGRVFITQGFIAIDAAGHTVLLGRGGSDTSGAYFAAKLQAVRLEIWTDVPGMFSANPKGVPNARLLKQLHYDEAQEIASSGAKVLHPRCIQPVRQYGIPLYVYATQTPELEGTHITANPAGGDAAQVKAIAIKKGITLISMDSPGMWHQVGFLADVFQVFKQRGLSVDLVSTSETNVTVSLDPAANTLDDPAIAALSEALAGLCRTQVIGPCAALSLVGRNIRGILHDLGEALALFEEQRIYLVSQAANDLNFTFVIDEEQGDRLVLQLHELLIRAAPNDVVLGPTWEQLHALDGAPAPAPPWWRERRTALLEHFGSRDSAYVYDIATVRAAAAELRALGAVAHVHYAMKANPHGELLRTLAASGIGFDCVSQGEIEHLLREVPAVDRSRILFTPNFAPRAEYEWAIAQQLRVTLDNLHPLREWPRLFAGRELFVRIDTGRGHGHHAHVRTAGVHTKFGVPQFEVEELERLARAAGARIVGLHAHTGSGNFSIDTWIEVAEALARIATRFTEVTVLDLGGGLGVPDNPSRLPVDVGALGRALDRFKARQPAFELWLEPGRYLVAAAGVLLARVTQLKGKGAVQYVGVATGMNSLIRPALYGAHHEIVNLTRLAEPATETYEIVGPICESADVLGHERQLPVTREGDVLLIATAGAYGHSMSSRYNLREPAEELLL
ncbi:MAG TPA: bifunctional aspartate kinase/diaminopimelate decarboxylase [Steroidobacteraceae bacterium]|nr:bifunctional aspartate kinase/diaminopimelate decarboxylase [Steroidobacteraceae bacterium]